TWTRSVMDHCLTSLICSTVPSTMGRLWGLGPQQPAPEPAGSPETAPKRLLSVSEPALDQAMATIYLLGPFRLDAEAAILFRGAEPVALGRRAVALLSVLVERPGIPVSKDALIEATWPGLTVEENNLTVQISALRRVFGEEPGGEQWIETLQRRGYRFVGPVTVEDRGGIATAAPVADLAGAGTPSLALPNQPSIAVL